MKAKVQSKVGKAAPVVARAAAPRVRQVNVDERLTVLQVGDIVDLGPGLGGEHIVWKCNDCRALCVPSNRSFQFKDGESGREIEFNPSMKLVGISPNSEVPILRRLGKSGMIEFLENKTKQKDENKMSKEAKAVEKKEKSAEPSLGRLGGFQGFAVTAVIRAMAVAGWEYWECRHVFDANKVEVADNTIRIQLSAGRAGKGGAPAELTKKYLASIRPDADEKPAAARKAAKPAKAEKAVVAKKKAKVAPVEDEDDEEDDEEDAPPAPKAKSKKPAVVEDEEEAETEDGE